jgi:archaeosortase B (VPXXXP-CTERM-specific)
MPAATGFSWFLIGLTARTSAWLINLAGIEARLSGDVIGLSNQSLLINAECTAIYLMIFFGSFVIVYPARWISKMVGLVAGIPVIFTANVSRLLLTAYVVEFRPGYFQYFHDYMWQVAFIIFVVVLWWLWIELVVKYDARNALSG